jgi:hypothetical protein
MLEINAAQEIIEKLRLEGKTRFLDKPEDIEAMIKMNEAMERVTRESIYKQKMSEIGAKECWVYQNSN